MKPKNPEISVILPVKDGDFEALLRAVKSVEDQTVPDYEILLINDGSESEYAERLSKLAEGNERIRLFSMESSGVSAARNLGLDKALGNIITFLDCDDMLSPFSFEEAISIFSGDDADALWGGTFYGPEPSIMEKLQEKGSSLSEAQLEELMLPLKPQRLHLTKAECIGEPFRFEGEGYISRGIAGRFIRKSCFEGVAHRFPLNIKFYEDAIWNLGMLSELKVCYVKRIWYYYFQNETSVSNTFHPDIIERMEAPIHRIRSIIDTGNDIEYEAYTRLLADSLRYVYKCLIGNPEWGADKKEKKEISDYLYSHEPWSEIGSSRFMEKAGGRDLVKARLFRRRLLFAYWKYTWKKM